MRLSDKEIATIKTTITSTLGEGDIYIFGSRLDERKRGGDIDICFVPKRKIGYEQKLLAQSRLKSRLYKPVDLVVAGISNEAIVQEGLKGVKI